MKSITRQIALRRYRGYTLKAACNTLTIGDAISCYGEASHAARAYIAPYQRASGKQFRIWHEPINPADTLAGERPQYLYYGIAVFTMVERVA